MNKHLFHWRLFVLAIMTSLLLTKAISSKTFLAMIVGVLLFAIIPECANALLNKNRKEEPSSDAVAEKNTTIKYDE